ncbi:hypothetical protein TIFTF001_051092 [Ficus carica]|uniref:Uncharacterized protein n=1 Tax=Ficus carica TaxID=3494 RepID=A0AA88CXH6_FICCA|nr:hypothetical protein TIFTF001_051092 [Ficus carica]
MKISARDPPSRRHGLLAEEFQAPRDHGLRAETLSDSSAQSQCRKIAPVKLAVGAQNGPSELRSHQSACHRSSDCVLRLVVAPIAVRPSSDHGISATLLLLPGVAEVTAVEVLVGVGRKRC